MQRPEKNRSHERLKYLDCYFFFLQTRVDLSVLLPRRNHVRNNSAPLFHVALNNAAHAFARQKTGDQRAGQVGTAPWFLGRTLEEVLQCGLNGLFVMVHQRCGLSYLSELNFRHHAEYVFFTPEIVEEGAFTYIRCLSNVFYCNVGETALGEELKGAAKQAQTRFGSAALAAPHTLQMGQVFSDREIWELGWPVIVTTIHK